MLTNRLTNLSLKGQIDDSIMHGTCFSFMTKPNTDIGTVESAGAQSKSGMDDDDGDC